MIPTIEPAIMGKRLSANSSCSRKYSEAIKPRMQNRNAMVNLLAIKEDEQLTTCQINPFTDQLPFRGCFSYKTAHVMLQAGPD